MRVLILDAPIDDVLLNTLLGENQYKIVHVDSHEQTFGTIAKWSKKYQIDLIYAPNTDGYTFNEFLHSREETASIPIRLYSSLHRKDSGNQLAHAKEVSLVIVKPYETDPISDVIRPQFLPKLFSGYENIFQRSLILSKMSCWEWDFINNQVIEYGYLDPFAICPAHSSVGTFEGFFCNVEPNNQDSLATTIQKTIETKTFYNTEFKFIMMDGTVQWIAARGEFVYNENRIAIGMIGVCSTVTDRKNKELMNVQYQRDLDKAGRMQSIVEITSRLAHELNHPFTAIDAYATGCLNLLNKREQKLGHALRKIKKNVQLASEIVQQATQHNYQTPNNYSVVCINELILEVLSIMGYENRIIPVLIERSLQNKLTSVKVDKIQIGQVLTNLIQNGIDAMSQLNQNEQKLCIHTSEDNDFVLVKVKDNGNGISERVLPYLFSPNVTTKKDGMGIGLSICRSIISSHGGEINGFNLPEGGGCFQFSLPKHIN